VVDHFVEAVTAPVESSTRTGSWLTTALWTEAFVTQLKAHHALSLDPLSTTEFEAAFNVACRAARWKVDPAQSLTHRFFDTVITIPRRHPFQISLKASSAKDMRPEKVHISKLTEAAWIQDTRVRADRRKAIVDLFKEYRETTTSIIMLRGFRRAEPRVLDYELLEIPTSLFTAVDSLSLNDAQLGTINIPPGQDPPDLAIRIDRSDSKITITNIRIDVCTVHGRWTLTMQEADGA